MMSKPNQASQIDVRQYPIYTKILQNMMQKQIDAVRKTNIKDVITKIKQKSDMFAIKMLNKDSQSLFVKLRYEYAFYKKAYDRVILKEEFKECSTDKIFQFFASVQEKVKFQNPGATYTTQMTLKKKAFNWNKEFMDAWNQEKRKVEKQKEQSDKLKQKHKQESIKKQSIAQINYQTSSQKNPTVLPSKQKSSKPEEESQSSQSTPLNQKQKKLPQTQPSKQELRMAPILQPKNSVKVMQKYLQQRKDLNIPNNKYKEYAQFICANLQKFMKHQMFKLIDVAKLRNKVQKNDQSIGNEFKYFSKDNRDIKISNSTQVMSPDILKIYKVNYRPKLEIYSMLRVKEEIFEEKLLKQFQKKKESDKKSDRRMWDYLLKPKQSDKAQSYVEQQQKSSDRLTLDLCHIRYLFQQHPYIRESFLMFSCFNS